MPYAERPVAPGVELWQATGRSGPTRILPDGCIDVILVDGRLLVAGPDTSARMHSGASGSSLVGIRLHAGRAPRLLGLPADELTDRSALLADIWSSRAARELTEAVQDDPKGALIRWSLGTTVDARSERIRDLLESGHTAAQTADRLGYSARQLQRQTRAAFGYGPRRLARVLRIARLTRVVDSGQSWADLAHAAGFSDQAHLSREVRDLVGLTPTRWRQERVRSVQDTDPGAPLACSA